MDQTSEQEVQEALARLQLPHMNTNSRHDSSVGSNRRRRRSSSRDRDGVPITIMRSSSNALQPPQAGFQTRPYVQKGRKDRRQRSSNTCNSEEAGINPILTILVCADIDLKSTSALAEYTLQQQHLFQKHQQKQRRRAEFGHHHHYHFESTSHSSATSDSSIHDDYNNKNAGFDTTAIDLIIAAGPCARDDDLASYYRGKQRRNHRLGTQHHPYGTTTTSNTNTEVLAPFFRSREKSAALEGLMTAALSQLESIVCRVVYCPGFNDPLSTILPPVSNTACRPDVSMGYKRLTPNSRNINQQWLPLAPGLGCAALFYLDSAGHFIQKCNDDVVDGVPHLNHSSYWSHQSDHYCSHHADRNIESEEGEDTHTDDDEADESGTNNPSSILSEQLLRLQQQSPDGYCPTLKKLLQLAPPAEHPVFKLCTASQNNKKQQEKHQTTQQPLHKVLRCQSILVTNYVDSQALLQRQSKRQENEVEWWEEGDYEKQSNQNHHHQGSSTDSSSDEGMYKSVLGDQGISLNKSNNPGHSNGPEISSHDMMSSNTSADNIFPQNLPWPPEHDDFLVSDIVQQHLCLEIASGYAADHEPAWIDGYKNKAKGPRKKQLRKHHLYPFLKNSSGPVLLPGSLRERGEFCILELALIDEQNQKQQQSKTKPVQSSSSAAVAAAAASLKQEHRRFAWEVQTVKFHRMA